MIVKRFPDIYHHGLSLIVSIYIPFYFVFVIKKCRNLQFTALITYILFNFHFILFTSRFVNLSYATHKV